jgi:hypothetical protein
MHLIRYQNKSKTRCDKLLIKLLRFMKKNVHGLG